jgi:hypothetical protein
MRYKRDLIIKTRDGDIRIPAHERELLNFRFTCALCAKVNEENLLGFFGLVSIDGSNLADLHYSCSGCENGGLENIAFVAAQRQLDSLELVDADLVRELRKCLSRGAPDPGRRVPILLGGFPEAHQLTKRRHDE